MLQHIIPQEGATGAYGPKLDRQNIRMDPEILFSADALDVAEQSQLSLLTIKKRILNKVLKHPLVP